MIAVDTSVVVSGIRILARGSRSGGDGHRCPTGLASTRWPRELRGADEAAPAPPGLSGLADRSGPCCVLVNIVAECPSVSRRVSKAVPINPVPPVMK